MNAVADAWRVAVGVGSLAAVVLTVAQILVERVRSGSFTEAFEATWVTRREFYTSVAAAVLGWALGMTLLDRHGSDWESSLILGLAGALLFTTVYWMITKGGRSLVLLALLIFLLPAVTGFVVSY